MKTSVKTHQVQQTADTQSRQDGKAQEPSPYGLDFLDKSLDSGLQVQPKLTIGAPDDPFEREADAMAAFAVQHIQGSSEPIIQRKCKDCEEKEKEMAHSSHRPMIQRKCAKCEEEELRRKALSPSSSTANVHPAFSQQLRARKGVGRSLPKGIQQEMGAVFGRDFRAVSIHTDAPAIQMSQQIGAKAFTHGNDIYFNRNEFKPNALKGQELLAHELTHVVQQGGDGQKDIVQRKPAGFDAIKEKLDYGAIDWEITDEDANWVLKKLDEIWDRDKADKSKSRTELKKMVKALEQDGDIDDLFENVGKDDQITYSKLLETIHTLRVHKKEDGSSYIGSCTPEELSKLDTIFPKVAEWAEKGSRVVDKFLQKPKEQERDPQAYRLLDKYFFHQTTHGDMPLQREIKTATQVKKVIEMVGNIKYQGNGKKNDPKVPITCLSPFKPKCRTFAAAYVNSKGVHLCPSYFERDDVNSQVETMFHELVHHFTRQQNKKTRVRDSAYDTERVFALLAPEDALNSSDAYTLLVKEVVKGKDFTDPRGMRIKDKTENCGPELSEKIKLHIAFGQRMIQNAISKIDSNRKYNKAGGILEEHFKTTKKLELKKIKSTYKKAKKLLRKSQTIICKPACKDKLFGIANGNIEICPLLAAQSKDDKFGEELLATILLNTPGIKDGPARDEAGYGNQSKEEARINVNSYVGYARAISAKDDQWAYLQADDRYGAKILTQLNDLQNAEYAAIQKETAQFRGLVDGAPSIASVEADIFLGAGQIISKVRAELEDIKIDNQKGYERHLKVYKEALLNYMQAGRAVAKVYISNSLDVLILSLLEEEADRETWEEIAVETLDNHYDETGVLLEDHAIDCLEGKRIDPKNWKALETVDQEFSRQLNLIRSYVKHYEQFSGLEKAFEKYADNKLKKVPKKKKRDYRNLKRVLLQELADEVVEIQDKLEENIVSEKKFEKRMVPIKGKKMLRKYKKQFDMGPDKYFKKYPDKQDMINPYLEIDLLPISSKKPYSPLPKGK